MAQLIGVDSGGTFTDAVIVTEDSQVAIGKALTTPRQVADGVLEAIGNAAQALSQTRCEALRQARIMAHGTTVGLNVLLTQCGARIGLLMTDGFEDTIPIARQNKALGLDEEEFREATRWDKPPLLLPRRRMLGVAERVDARGDILLPLDEDQARKAIRKLKAEGVEAVGICLLWSFINSEHERRLGGLVAEEMAGIHITLSSDLVARIGEYERAMTVVLNSYVAPAVSRYLDDLIERLEHDGFSGSFYVLQSSGGVQKASRLARRPIDTLKSGPIGGLSAGLLLGKQLGHNNIICSDVGGTSFDVGLIVDGRLQYARRPMIGRYAIASPVVDIESIGTGGGSIARVDEQSGALCVGPISSGSDPGPACYGRGATEPTVTDAAVTLGYLHQLSGQLTLDMDAAMRAIQDRIARPLGLDVRAAAEGILSVSNAQMADLISRMTVQRGVDPRDFVLYAYGGAAPQYAGRYAADLGVQAVIIPRFASAFSAYGAIASDLRTSCELDAPRHFPPDIDWLNQKLSELEQAARTDLGASADHDVDIRRWAGLRFRRQVHELRVELPLGTIIAGVLDSLATTFHDEYERLYGRDTAYTAAGVELVGLRVEASLPLPTPSLHLQNPIEREPQGHRFAWFSGQRFDCAVFDGERLANDVIVNGPAFIELPTTTVVVYPGQLARVDAFGNIELQLESTDE